MIQKIYKFFLYSSLKAPYWRGKAVYQQITHKLLRQKLKRSLDLGSGPLPDNRFGAAEAYGVDIRCADNQRVFACDLSAEALPFAENHFDLVTAWDLLEHIPRVAQGPAGTYFPFVQLMNEIWRVLQVEGCFFSFTPAFPMPQAFQDPTHVNIITEDTLRLYFAELAWARIYGFHGQFRLVHEGWKDGHYFCLLQKTSDQPLADLESAQKAD